LLVGAGILYIYLSGFTSQQLQAVWESIKLADWRWLILSLVFGLISHILRAYRWYYLLEPLNYHPRKINLILAVGLSYLLNLAVPRAGEVGRAASLTKYEKNLKFEKVFGTIVAERMADIVFLLLFIFLAILLQFDLIYAMVAPKIPENPLQLLMRFLIVIIVMLFLLKLLKKSKHGFILKIKEFVTGLWQGIKSILSMPRKWIFILQTTLIWLLYFAMFWVVLWAFPETENLSIESVVVAFVAGSIAMVVSNGGFGVYPVFVAEALALYNVPLETGTAFGLLMWSTQTLLVILFGLFCLFFLPVYNTKFSRK